MGLLTPNEEGSSSRARRRGKNRKINRRAQSGTPRRATRSPGMKRIEKKRIQNKEEKRSAFKLEKRYALLPTKTLCVQSKEPDHIPDPIANVV
jgi:hypothetical protein